MFDKHLEKKLAQALKNIDPQKLNQVKNMLNEKDSSKILEKIDVKKAQAKLGELNLSGNGDSLDLGKLVGELKKDPSLLDNLKKKL